MSTKLASLSELESYVGKSFGTSEWIEVNQNRINTFAEATNDHQWIHTDPERAKDGPFGTTVAHGYLSLSLLIPLWDGLLTVDSVTSKVNYGLNKVRFPAPVPVDSKVRITAELVSLEPIPGGAQLTVDIVMERAEGTKPVCVAQSIFRFYE